MSRLLASAVGLFVLVAVGLSIYYFHSKPKPNVAVENVHLRPIVIPGIQEPEEMQVEPIPVVVLPPAEQMLDEAMQQAGSNSATVLPAIDRILAKYPNFSDGYFMRLGTLCSGSDLPRILSDINSALAYSGDSLASKDLPGSLLSMRGKIEHSGGYDADAIGDLDKAIQANLTDPTEFVNSGATAPEKTASACTWTAPDMDALVHRFPDDFRVYLFRGLYFGFFSAWNQESLNPALENLRKAGEMNSSSAIPHLFVASTLKRAFGIKQLGMSDAKRTELNHAMLSELDKALAIDPNLLPALTNRAETYFELKQFERAIPDYDKILVLDPKDAAAYNDRGMAKMQLGDTYGGISDFGKAIENEKRQLQRSSSEENRADAYIRTGQWDPAIRDLTTAISLQVGGVSLLMNVNQFRALYPEYKAASDEAIARKLNQTFYPNMKYEDFSKGFLRENVARGFFGSTTIPDIYIKRSDANLHKGNWHLAAVDYWRAVNGFPEYANAVDRWREIGPQLKHFSVDLRTFDDTSSSSTKIWIKQTKSSEPGQPYSMQRYELNCTTRQLRTLSIANYSASGKLESSHEGLAQWESIVPETMGEELVSGGCHNN